MSRLDVWHEIPVNTSKRPILLQGESELYARDHVGLYQGKLKFRELQNGRVYLTNQRVMFLDSGPELHAVGVYLRHLSKTEYIDKFLRSLPKVKLYLRERDAAPVSAPLISDWVCQVCSFNNHYTHSEEAPKCVACGILASPAQVASMQDANSTDVVEPLDPGQCPKCTFLNHPSMRFCEMCGAPLKKPSKPSQVSYAQDKALFRLVDPESYTNDEPYIKLSFRKGGLWEFYQLAKHEIEKLLWQELQAKGEVNGHATKVTRREEVPNKVLHGGISAIERSDEMKRLANERVLSLSLNDLEQLMYQAEDVLKLAQSFSGLVKVRPKPGNLGTLGNISDGQSPMELARNVSEFLVNSELTRPTSMATVQDVYASYNRYRLLRQGYGGTLVSSGEFQACLPYFDTLQLPVKTKTFSSGLAVLTRRNNSREHELHLLIMEYVISEENRFFLEKFESEHVPDADGYMQSQHRYFRGKSVVDIALHFGWDTTICTEEIDRCLEKALLVQDNHISGTFFHVNKFDQELLHRLTDHEKLREEARQRVVLQQTDISSELKSQFTSDELVAVQEYGQVVSLPQASMYSESLLDLDGLHFD